MNKIFYFDLENDSWIEELTNIIWSDKGKIKKARRFIFFLIEEILKEICPMLNQIHHKNYEMDEWRLLIQPWLDYHLSSMYDKYLRVNTAIQQYENVALIIHNPCDFYIATDYTDFVEHVSNDKAYQQQQYLSIFKFLDLNIIFTNENERKDISETKNLVRQKMSQNRIIDFVSSKRFFPCKLLIYHAYLSKSVISNVEKLSLGKIRNGKLYDYQYSYCNAKYKKRKLLNKSLNLSTTKNFMNCILYTIWSYIPIVYMEAFKNLEKISRQYFNIHPKIVLTSIAVYADEVFKIFLMRHKKNILLYGLQHGGNYGTMLDAGYYEYKICDTFYTYGWKEKRYTCNFKPMPIGKLSSMTMTKANNTNCKILYTNYIYAHYIFRFYDINEILYNKTIALENIFIQSLDNNVRNKFKVRLYVQDYNQNRKNFFMQYFNKNQINNQEDFYHDLTKCSLLVSHILCTTFIEAMAFNKPCIVFCPLKFYDLEPNIKPILYELKKVGILHENPKSAALLLNRIYNKIDIWWRQPQRQKAVKNFQHHCAYLPKYSNQIWMKELFKLIK